MGDLHPLPKSHEEKHKTDDRLEVQSSSIEHSVDPSFVHSKSIHIISVKIFQRLVG